MDLHEFIRMTTIINRLAKRALFAEKQMVALEGQCAEWKRIADDLKAERNALRSTTIDTATGRLLDAFGSLANEPRNGSPDDKYHVRIVTKIHAIKLDRDALRKERDDLRTQLATERERYKQTPCDPPASHDTPAGKETAQAAAKPKPGDMVRLVRVPTADEYPHDTGRWEPNWGGIGDYMRVHHIGNNINGTRIVRAAFGLEWPISCIEIVEDAK